MHLDSIHNAASSALCKATFNFFYASIYQAFKVDFCSLKFYYFALSLNGKVDNRAEYNQAGYQNGNEMVK
ncbi:hypothetical protein ES706_05775 [subsurface metagenome]